MQLMRELAAFYVANPKVFWAFISLIALGLLMWGLRGRKKGNP